MTSQHHDRLKMENDHLTSRPWVWIQIWSVVRRESHCFFAMLAVMLSCGDNNRERQWRSHTCEAKVKDSVPKLSFIAVVFCIKHFKESLMSLLPIHLFAGVFSLKNTAACTYWPLQWDFLHFHHFQTFFPILEDCWECLKGVLEKLSTGLHTFILACLYMCLPHWLNLVFRLLLGMYNGKNCSWNLR